MQPDNRWLSLVKSILATNGCSAGSDSLLNGLPWWIYALSNAGNDLIMPVVNIARR